MSYIFKGFATYPGLVNNSPNAIHPFGELSAQGMTYCRDRDIYSGGTGDKITLYTYISEKDKVDEDVSAVRQKIIFDVTNLIYTKSISAAQEIFSDEIEQDLWNSFGSHGSHFVVGPIVTDNSYWMPTYVSWTSLDEKDTFKVWFSDTAFRNQFPEYTITGIPPIPIENIDIFVTAKPAQIKAILEENNIAVLSDRVEVARLNQPPTTTPWMEHDWIYPLDKTVAIPTTWVAHVYGLAGNNSDAINDALADLILKNSEYDRDTWKEIFPSIFKRNEFIIIPQWDKLAIEQRITTAGVYSPIARIKDNYKNYFMPYTARYPQIHVDTYGTIVAHQWKSIQMYMVGGNENRDNKFLLTDHYPDFLAVNTSGEDFNRQKLATRAFSEMLLEMLLIAETMTEFSDVDVKYKRVWRDEKMFLAHNLNKVNYLVVAKYNFDNK